MAKTSISVEDYLHTSFAGVDPEYRDGDLIERSVPDYLHGKTQLLLAAFFAALRKQHTIFPCTETRMKIRSNRYVIPDVAVFWPQEPGLVPDGPPLVAVEILSPDDRLTDVRDKLDEYRQWGVRHAWLIDPHARRLYVYGQGLLEQPVLGIPELGIELTPADLFE